MSHRSRRSACGTLIAAMLTGLLVGCASSLLPKPAAPPALFTLSAESEAFAAPAPGAPTPTPTLIVNLPRAAPGFDTSQIVYVRRPYEIAYFAHNRWVDTPSTMLAPMMVGAIERSGAFHAVLGAPTSATGQLRLETELVRLQQDFSTTPSHVRLTLRATLVDATTRRVIAGREFDVRVNAPSDDPYGGVMAAQRAASQVLPGLAAFCAESVAR